MKFIFYSKKGLDSIVWVCWFHELIFSSSLKWKHKRIEFMMKKIYIHLRHMELCVCITDYDDIHKRELKDFWQLLRVLRDDSRFRNNIPWTYETKKKISVFNVRVDNCMKSERKWHQRVPASCELYHGSLWTLALADTVQEMPGCFLRAELFKAVNVVPNQIIVPAPNIM